MTARERALAILAILIALLTAATSSLQWSGQQRERYANAQADLILARQIRAATAHEGLDGFNRAQVNNLDALSLNYADPWMARLDLERRIVAAAAEAGLSEPEIRIAEGIEDSGGLPVLKAEITGAYAAAPFVAFLKRMTVSPPEFFIDRLQVEGADTTRFRLELLFPAGSVGQPTHTGAAPTS
ncbi:hypothetical protein ASD79_00625 [Caulobacter sp. Root655]|uniref:hypothetical protein n=1 Tax=Caulobacter sp. Root655 TaxID=1736578 RepID=UPI0006F98A0E|nr:hypothetical protein [Caulobacter sp. Root655]KRA65822.1 hypothetical protein ASD79_00625 [Caulobacter sp. Root655]